MKSKVNIQKTINFILFCLNTKGNIYNNWSYQMHMNKSKKSYVKHEKQILHWEKKPKSIEMGKDTIFQRYEFSNCLETQCNST